MNSSSKKPLPSWLPFVVGGLLVIQFIGLGAWQISRGFEKRETQQIFKDEGSFSEWSPGTEPRPYQRIRVAGRYDTEHQILLENIILNSRYGYYVITPMDLGVNQPLLLVNRGWVEKPAAGAELHDIAIDTDASLTSARGFAGSLPKAGYKMGDAFAAQSTWPKRAVYPSAEEVAATLGRRIQPFVLLLDSHEPDGFLRQWVPTEFGPGKHFGYALQWLAMATVLSGLLIWNFRKKRFDQ